jgi:pantoate--beta-alanine ligase
MGALHAGHRALVDAAAATGAGVAASIFVNPLQFGPSEDFRTYPRDEADDLAQLREAGCQLAWLPDVGTMYPADGATTIDVAGPGERWEGEHRPGHFRGVATVVAKLFGQVRPDLAFFGEKDWQQVQVVRRMVADLHLPLAIVAVPTVREADGLALSSRNRRLTPEERRIAPLLYREMQETVAALASGIAAAGPLARAVERLRQAGFVPDYFALVDGPTLAPLDRVQPGSRLIAAARLGTVRLIDNVPATGFSRSPGA